LDLGDATDERLVRGQSLSADQGAAVFKFLKFMSQQTIGGVDSVAADRAIEAYWGKFKDTLLE
jgi:hypothetical protein